MLVRCAFPIIWNKHRFFYFFRTQEFKSTMLLDCKAIPDLFCACHIFQIGQNLFLHYGVLMIVIIQIYICVVLFTYDDYKPRSTQQKRNTFNCGDNLPTRWVVRIYKGFIATLCVLVYSLVSCVCHKYLRIHIPVRICYRNDVSGSEFLPGHWGAMGIPLHTRFIPGEGLLRSRLQQLPWRLRDQHSHLQRQGASHQGSGQATSASAPAPKPRTQHKNFWPPGLPVRIESTKSGWKDGGKGFRWQGREQLLSWCSWGASTRWWTAWLKGYIQPKNPAKTGPENAYFNQWPFIYSAVIGERRLLSLDFNPCNISL